MPPVRLVQAREPLVLEQRLDHRMLDVTQLVRARAVDLDPGRSERPGQLDRRVRVQRGRLERDPDVAGEPLEHHGPAVGRDPRPEQALEQALVVVAPPRETRVVHLRCGERPGGLRRDQKAQGTRSGGSRDLRDLAVELLLGVQRVTKVEGQRAVVARGSGVVPAVRGQRGDRAGGAGRTAEQTPSEAQVPGACHADTGPEQPWIHVRRVPDPPRALHLECGDSGWESGVVDALDDAVEGERQAVVRAVHDRRAFARRRVRAAVHGQTVERTSDIARPRRR